MTLSFDQQAHAEPAAIAAPDQQRMPSGLREEFAAHFGADFDDIGLAPTAAAPAVTANGADAVTVGDAIAFGETAYQPESRWGRELIAHELAHVVQQRGGTGGPSLTDPAAYEQQADAAAHAALAGHDVPALSAAPAAAQPRVSMRDVGRGEQSGFGRVPELMDRLNHISLGLVFTLTHEGRFDWLTYTRILPVELCSEFDKQMMAFIDDGADILMRFTNRHGLLGGNGLFTHPANPDGTGPQIPNFVEVDAWQSGYVDIDDLLASSDLGLSTSMVHQLRERQRTPNYEHRIGIETGPGALVTTPGLDAEFQRAHLSGLQAELALLRDFFGDPKIQAVDIQARRFRNSRGDIIREKETAGRTRTTSGILAITWEVVIHGTHQVMTAEDYLVLLERERAAAAGAAAGGTAAGVGVP
jgi:hypothetical protein